MSRAIWGVIKAIPVLLSVFRSIIDLYIADQVSKIESVVVTERSKRDALIKAIQEAETNEQIVTYSVILDDYNSGRMRS
jgi:hypothetical protein